MSALPQTGFVPVVAKRTEAPAWLHLCTFITTLVSPCSDLISASFLNFLALLPGTSSFFLSANHSKCLEAG